MKYYVKHSLLFFIFGLSTVAVANNIRVIGKGGGIDEMEALSFFDQIPALIQFCLMENNPCALDSDDAQKLALTAGHPNLWPQRLSFKSDSAAPVLFSDRTLQVSTQELSYASLFSTYINVTTGTSTFSRESAAEIFDKQKIKLNTLGLKRSSADGITPVLNVFRGRFGALILIRQGEIEINSIQFALIDAFACGFFNII